MLMTKEATKHCLNNDKTVNHYQLSQSPNDVFIDTYRGISRLGFYNAMETLFTHRTYITLFMRRGNQQNILDTILNGGLLNLSDQVAKPDGQTGNTALYIAAKRGDEASLTLLLD